MPRIVGALWREEGEWFVNDPLPPEPTGQTLPTSEATLPDFGTLRNAKLTCAIELVGEPRGSHGAVLFRKNGSDYLGAGLGGWGSQFSLFVRTRAGIVGYPIGTEANIKRAQVYNIGLEFRAGHVTHFSADGESLIVDRLSLRDTLQSSLSRGSIGLYAWAATEARFQLQVEELPNRCFVITNINGNTPTRREKLIRILKDAGVECDLMDAKDLRRERPLMRKIKEGITSSDFVLADFGFEAPRPNVFYETGIAHSLGIPTIHLGPVPDRFGEVVPSDLKPQFFVLEDELERELPATVSAILKSSVGSFDYLGGE